MSSNFPNETNAHISTYTPETTSHELGVLAITLTSLVFVVVSSRVYSRAILLGFMGADDYCILLATVTAVGLAATCYLSVTYGLGKNFSDTPTSSVIRIAKLAYIIQLLYVASLGFTKASLNLLLVRLSLSIRTLYLNRIIFGLTTTLSVSALFASAFGCTPPSYAWTRIDPMTDTKGKCLKFPALQYSIQAFGITTDFIVWLLLLKLIFQVRLSHKQKLGMYIVFLIGGLVPIAAVMRLVILLRLAAAKGDVTADLPRVTIDLIAWSIIEVTIAIICGSILVTQPLFKKFRSFILSTVHVENDLQQEAGHHGLDFPGNGKNLIPLDSTAHINFVSTERLTSARVMKMTEINKGTCRSSIASDRGNFPEPKPSCDLDSTIRSARGSDFKE